MVQTMDFLYKFDEMWMEEDLRVYRTFRRYFREYLEAEDYDTFVTLYASYLNICMNRELKEYSTENEISDLPEHIENKVGIEIYKNIVEWHEKEKERFTFLVEEFVTEVIKFYTEHRRKIPEGFEQLLRKVGKTLITGTMLNDEYLERNWEIVDTMLCLGYKVCINDKIREGYREDYYKANEFVKSFHISLPYYYVLVWDLWKAGRDNWSDSYKHNQIRIRKLVPELPELYRDLLSGYIFNPRVERYEGESDEDVEDGKVMAIHIIDHIHIEECLPSFISYQPDYDKCRNSFHMDKEKKYRHEFYHPLPMMHIPCTYLYKNDNTNIPSYVNEVYQESLASKYREYLRKYEVTFRDNMEKVTKLHLDVSKSVSKTENEAIPEKELLICKLENNSKRVADILSEKKSDDCFLERFVDAGFSKKTYYDFLRIHKNSEYKSIPAKDTVIALACAMRLDLETTRDLLVSCGYIFSPACERDLIIEHMIEHKRWELDEINAILEDFKLKKIVGKSKRKRTKEGECDDGRE